MNHIENSGSNILLVSNTNAKELTERIQKYLSELFGAEIMHRNMPYKAHANSEVDGQFHYSVRGKDVYIVSDPQGGTSDPSKPSINDNLMEALLRVNGYKENGAATATLIIPFFPYGRQDKQDSPGLKKKEKRVPAGYRMVHDMIKLAGVDTIVTMDIHNTVDIARGVKFVKLPIGWLIKQVVDLIGEEDLVMSTTDVGGGTKLRAVGEDMEIPVITVEKKKDYTKNSNVKEIKINAGEREYKGKHILIYDDMIDTGGTLCKVIDAYEEKGAKEISVVSTLPIFDGDALALLQERYERGVFKKLYVTSSIAHQDLEKYPWIEIIDCAPILTNTIYSLHTDQEIDYNDDSLPSERK